MNKEIDLTNKVILDLDDYIKTTNRIKDLEHSAELSAIKYQNIIKYLFSECKVREYASGRKYLNFDAYDNHLADYLKEIEPEKYSERLEIEEQRND